MKTKYEVFEKVWKSDGEENCEAEAIHLENFEHYVEARMFRSRLILETPLADIKIQRIEVADKCGRCYTEAPLFHDYSDGRMLCQNCLRDSANTEAMSYRRPR